MDEDMFQCDPDPIVSDDDTDSADDTDERAMLRYEEQITELLVTIANLNRRAEHLQQKAIRNNTKRMNQSLKQTSSQPVSTGESSDDKKLDQAFVCNTESKHSLGNTESRKDLFAELQRVLTSLEDLVHVRENLGGVAFSCEGAEEYISRLNTAKEQWCHTMKALEDLEKELGLLPSLEPLSEENNQRQEERASLRKRNAVLRTLVREKEEDLRKSKITLCTFHEERDKLHQKVQELQGCLKAIDGSSPPLTPENQSVSLQGSASAISRNSMDTTAGHQDHVVTSGDTIQSAQHCQSVQDLIHLLYEHKMHPGFEKDTRNFETEIKGLQRCIEQNKSQNEALSMMLEEWKCKSERLSMALGKHESNSSALQLALQYSDDCLDGYDVLLYWAEEQQAHRQKQWKKTGLHCSESKRCAEAVSQDVQNKTDWMISETKRLLGKLESKPLTNEGAKCGRVSWEQPFSPKNREYAMLSAKDAMLLKEYAKKRKWDFKVIKAAQMDTNITPASIKQSEGIKSLKECVLTAANDITSTKTQDSVQPVPNVSPGCIQKSIQQKSLVPQDLMSIREDMSEIKAKARLLAKEKKGLELTLSMQRAQETACLLLIESLKSELDGQTHSYLVSLSSASSTGSETGRVKEIAARFNSLQNRPACGESLLAEEVLKARIREKKLKSRIQELTSSLEKVVRDNLIQKTQSKQLRNDLLNAHSYLTSTFKNTKRKYGEQLRKLEAQVTIMSERHGSQIGTLQQAISHLQGKEVPHPVNETPI
ncbi:colorectal mutant cancer protein-like [Protopterus annectens]|uniref:colorectal mutant cancer protein-like n=1 Tax=Protopterus annectens TaxID=7888 RepID=UPI001CFA716D|nr:colorectal mutant cancer protein-like [Protopterus annectens]